MSRLTLIAYEKSNYSVSSVNFLYFESLVYLKSQKKLVLFDNLTRVAQLKLNNSSHLVLYHLPASLSSLSPLSSFYSFHGLNQILHKNIIPLSCLYVCLSVCLTLCLCVVSFFFLSFHCLPKPPSTSFVS